MKKPSPHYLEFRRNAEKKLSALGLMNGNFPYLRNANIQDTTWFDNETELFFDSSSLPISCNSIKDLSNRFILYGIFCKGKFYVGKTANFGERMSTHLSDAKKREEKRLHKDMRNEGKGLAFVFCECPSQEVLDEAEHIAIKAIKDSSLHLAAGSGKFCKLIKEDKKRTQEYQLKYCYNIKN